jgi:Ca2+-binding RTX toxin-like protein
MKPRHVAAGPRLANVAGVLLVGGVALQIPAASAYVKNAPLWPDPDMTFRVGIPGDTKWNSAFQNAMSQWNSASRFKFFSIGQHADPCSDPNESPPVNGVDFVDTACGDEWGSDVLAITISWGNSVRLQSGIAFNANETWNVYSGPYGSIPDFRRVAVHELGHALGLGHEDDVPAIMNTYINDLESPTSDDIAGVAALYPATSGDDTLYGTSGNDTIDGKAGADTMQGKAGNDIYYVDNAGDVVIESAGGGTDTVRASITYTLPANVEKLRLMDSTALSGYGNSLNNTLTGNAASNVLDGKSGNDTLNGRGGKDTLTGGTGADRFLFDTTLNGIENVGRITDFNPADDTIRLENAIFTALLSTGTLPASAFRIGSTATTASHRVLYDPATGHVRYDADGTGPKSAVRFATLTTKPTLTNADFYVQ